MALTVCASTVRAPAAARSASLPTPLLTAYRPTACPSPAAPFNAGRARWGNAATPLRATSERKSPSPSSSTRRGDAATPLRATSARTEKSPPLTDTLAAASAGPLAAVDSFANVYGKALTTSEKAALETCLRHLTADTRGSGVGGAAALEEFVSGADPSGSALQQHLLSGLLRVSRFCLA